MPRDSLSAAHQTMNNIYSCYKDEVVMQHSIGSGGRELQDTSSVQLMRDSILRTISSSSVFDNQKRNDHREEIPRLIQPSIEMKFLEKNCSSFSCPKTQPEEPPVQTSESESQEKNEFKLLPLPDFEISGSFEASGEFFKENDNKKSDEGPGSVNDSLPNLTNSGKNSLKLAIRSKSEGIFEDCSTYNISCPDSSPEFRSNEIFTNSLGFYSSAESTDFGNSSETDCSYSCSEPTSLNSVNGPDEQTSLSDTFFTNLVGDDNGQVSKSQSQQVRPTSRKSSEQQARKNSRAIKEESKGKNEVADASGGRRNSKKIRRRHRKNHSKDPLVYDCPKCGVSYVVASKMANDGVCFHCDMWTSVEPEFVKREKLLTWNTCRIC